MKVYINAVFGSNGAYIEARCENGVRVPFRSLGSWNAKAKKVVREHLETVYGYTDIKFLT